MRLQISSILMSMRLRISSILVFMVVASLGMLLVALADLLLAAHIDTTINFVASDAGTYYRLYQDVYEDTALSESLSLFLIGIPILSMKLSDGSLLVVQFFNLALMAITLRCAMNCFTTLAERLAMLAGTLVFPYFLFGFLGLNKEVYAMCSAIFFALYLVRGSWRALLLALLLAMLARYYMFLSLLAMVVFFPRHRPPRYGLMLLTLLAISTLAPVVKEIVPEYSSEDVKEVSGITGQIFSTAIDRFGYALVYPVKYFALIPQRAYSIVLGSDRFGDHMEAVVSVLSLLVLLPALWMLCMRHPMQPAVRRLIVAGLVAPMPMMWSDIMHWRYYSFVYFLFLPALILHFTEPSGSGQVPSNPQHA